MADVVGRRFGADNKWSFRPDKSVAGTAAFFAASTATSYALVSWFAYAGCGGDALAATAADPWFVVRLAAVCGLSALVELLPFGDDNYNVPLAAALLSQRLLS